MTLRECAIVMAHTGICMLQGDNLKYFYDYVSELIGKPVYTHEILFYKNAIEAESKEDFLKLCKSAEKAEKYRWHDLRKNSSDLPEVGNIVTLCMAMFGKAEREDSEYPTCYLDEKDQWISVVDGEPITDTYNMVFWKIVGWREMEPFEAVQDD